MLTSIQLTRSRDLFFVYYSTVHATDRNGTKQPKLAGAMISFRSKYIPRMSQNTSIASLKYKAFSTRAGGFLLLVVAGLVVVVVVLLVVLVAGLAVFLLALLTRLVRVRALALVREFVPGRFEEAFVLGRVLGRCSIRIGRVSVVTVSIPYPILLFYPNIGWHLRVVLPDIHNPLSCLVAHLVRKHLEDGPLIARQVFRHGNLEFHPQITPGVEVTRPTCKLLHSHSRQSDAVTSTGTSRNPDLDLAFQGRNSHLSAQESGGEGNRCSV